MCFNNCGGRFINISLDEFDDQTIYLYGENGVQEECPCHRSRSGCDEDSQTITAYLSYPKEFLNEVKSNETFFAVYCSRRSGNFPTKQRKTFVLTDAEIVRPRCGVIVPETEEKMITVVFKGHYSEELTKRLKDIARQRDDYGVVYRPDVNKLFKEYIESLKEVEDDK